MKITVSIAALRISIYADAL